MCQTLVVVIEKSRSYNVSNSVVEVEKGRSYNVSNSSRSSSNRKKSFLQCVKL